MDTKHAGWYARKLTSREKALVGAFKGAKYLASKSNYWAPPVAAYAASNLKMSGGPMKSGLGGQGFRGSAAPIPSKPADSYQRKKKRFQKARKCRNMKGMKLKKEVCKLSNQIKELKNSESASLGKMTYRVMTPKRLLAATNTQGVTTMVINRTSDYEDALSRLKYYDPATPGTLITAAAATGTYQKNFLLKSIYAKLELRNNYQSDCEVTVYLCRVKADSSINPSAAWGDGITTDAGSIAASSELAQYPTDYDVFNDLWSCKRVVHKILSPGESTTASHSLQDIEYNPALVDEHSANYQQRFKCAEWLIVVRGCLSHDTAQDEQGLSQSGVDIIHHKTWKVSYDAGVNLSYIETNVALDTPTNGFVQSHQPIADNQAYSVA